MDRNVKKIFYMFFTFSIIILIIMLCTNYSYGANTNLPQNSTEILQKEIKAKILNEEKLTKENIEYSSTKSKGIKINKYLGEADSIVIPNKINGILVEEINNSAFVNSAQLEMIKVSKSISKSSNLKITNFEKNKTLSNDKYIVYSTIKKYNPYYIKYIGFSEELRNKLYSKPSKFIEQSSVRIITKDILPESFDLRNKIKVEVEDQQMFGICYAYATLTSLETNIALKYGVTEDFSDVHAATLCECGGNGGDFGIISEYLKANQGPVNESELSIEDVINGYNKQDEIKSLIYQFCESGKITQEEMERIREKIKADPEYYLEEYKEYSYVEGINNYNDYLKEIKRHIMNNGSLYASIVGPDSRVCQDYNGKMVMNTLEKYSPYSDEPDITVKTQGYHAVSIIGWDDNFSKKNFPKEFRPKNNGAFLVLNSWGTEWGENGYFWISYEDSMVNTDLNGITKVSKEKIDISNAEVSITGISREGVYIEQYTGEKIKLYPRVRINGNYLREYDPYYDEGEYEIIYDNNINVGMATMTIKRSKKIYRKYH